MEKEYKRSATCKAPILLLQDHSSHPAMGICCFIDISVLAAEEKKNINNATSFFSSFFCNESIDLVEQLFQEVDIPMYCIYKWAASDSMIPYFL